MKARIVSAVLAIPIVLAAVFCANPWALFWLAFVATAIGSLEIGSLLGGRPTRMPVVGIAAIALAGVFLSRGDWKVAAPEYLLITVGLVGAGIIGTYLLIVSYRSRIAAEASSLWVAGPLATLVALQASVGTEQLGWSLRSPVLMALLPLWAGDTAGILAGRAWGKKLLAPRTSPNKTVVGAVSNLLACVGVAWGIGSLLSYSLLVSLGCGLAAGVLGQMGDLFESALKRSLDKKDSGGILPGHGGLLDRIDSLLFAAPAVAAILIFLAESQAP